MKNSNTGIWKVHDTSIWSVIAFDSARLWVAIDDMCFSSLENPALLVFFEVVAKLDTEVDVKARELFVLDTISFNILLIAYQKMMTLLLAFISKVFQDVNSNPTSSIAEALEFISFFVCSTSSWIFSEKETNKLSNSSWRAAEFLDAAKLKLSYKTISNVWKNKMLNGNLKINRVINVWTNSIGYRFQNRCQVCSKTVYSFPYNLQLETGELTRILQANKTRIWEAS